MKSKISIVWKEKKDDQFECKYSNDINLFECKQVFRKQHERCTVS